jgi:multiple sugar transport system permease protein
MSLVGKVGRRRPRARVAIGIVYAFLTLGAVTTLYPFLLMASTAVKGAFDQNGTEVVPPYLLDIAALESKYVDDKYSGDRSVIESTRLVANADSRLITMYRKFLLDLPTTHWVAGFRTAPNQVTSRLQSLYQSWLRSKYRNDIQALNLAYLEENISFHTVLPPAEMPERKSWEAPTDRKFLEWQEFKSALPIEFRIPVREQRMWQEFVRGRYQNQFGDVPEELKGDVTDFESLPRLELHPLYREFRSSRLPDRYRDDSSEDRWRTISGQEMPIAAFERQFVHDQSNAIRWEFAFRNFAYVLDTVLLNGRAVWNTIFFCVLAILTQLTVNPLAAYALSRYPVKQSGQILIFLLATMAFPAEVAMIPSFLLLKDLGLLNTFAALVLPTAASGYMIFLLKGFFDSLPQELFEAGQLDGAREVTMMARIAVPLSKPVLGYLALIAFMGAYSAFIYAFLIAQDQQMWTLMVWIYQLQNLAPKSVMMAALTLAALPTLLVFLCAQNVIMRGIVLPDER